MKQAAAFPDAVTWIELAGLAGAALVPLTLADGLSLREAPSQSLGETIARFLGERQYCLSLDNCGHLFAACATQAGAVAACPRLRVVVTSREPLGLPEETVCHVPPLLLPAANAPIALATLSRRLCTLM